MKLKQDEPPGTMAKPATQEVKDLMSARWVADMIGAAAAAELELADFINAGAKTAEEIANAKACTRPPYTGSYENLIFWAIWEPAGKPGCCKRKELTGLYAAYAAFLAR